MAEQVSLYTSHQMNDPSPQVFQYYIDWTGNDVAQAAANYLGLQYDPTYGLLLVSPYGSQWIDLSSTLRAQNVTNGYQIVYISLQYAQQGFNQSTYPQQQSNTNGNNENSSIQQIQQIQIEDVDIAEIPTIEVGNSTFNESDSDDVDDIIIDQSITDFSTNAFGGLRASDLSLLTGESDSVSSKSVKIFTAYEFSEENPVEVSYKLSYKFDDLLSTAFHHLSHNREGRYCLLLQYSKEDCRWLKEGEYLEDFNPFDGMTMYVFKRDRPIKVNIEHHPSKTLLLDIQKPVKELVEDVAKKNGLETFLGFTLWSWDSKHKSFPMLPNLSIPQQTRSIKSVVFKRKYFIFSREDLSTLETTISAFQDAVVEFHQSKHAYINDDTALNFLALCFLAESDKPEISNISEHLLGYLPPTFTHGKQILPKLKPFIQKFEKVDRFNACRKVLRFLRRTPGFATTVYDNVKIEVKTNKKKTVVDMSIHISPLTIRIINPKSNVLEDRISISKIISLNLLGDNLEIQFSIVSADGRTGKYNFRCPQVEEMKSLIETYSQISKMIIYFRAQANASIAGFDLSAIDDKNRITLFTTTDLTNAKPRKYAYDSKFTGAALIKCAEQNLEIPADKNHVALVKLMKNSYRWIEPETILSFANVQDGMTVYILNNNRPIKIKHTDGHTKTLLLDITQTIESLTPLIFQKEALPNIVGYTFYTLEDPNNPRPLDTRYSIPEQTWKFDELLFKRRFYVLSGEVLQTPQAAFATVADCNTLLLDPTSPLKVSEDEIIQLGIMFLYSRASSPEEIKVNKKINYEELIPSYIKTDKKFDAKFQKALASFPPQDKLQAAKNYLGFIRQLRGFGEEKFTVIYTDMSFGSHCKPIINTSLSIGPLKIIITPPNAKQQLHSIPYQFIISFQSMAHRLSMKFVDNGKIMTAEFKIREIDTALMLINYNIKIIRDLMLAKQRKKQKDEEDTAKRLNGGYIDENGVLRTRMLDFLISAKLDRRENLPKMWIEVNKTGKEVADLIVPILRLNNKIEYAILLWMLRKYYKWVGNEETLASKNPYRRTIMFILEAYPKVKVIFTMGATKTIIIHIIKTIAEIVPVIAQKLGLKHAIGFTLYLPIEGKESKPLNLTLSLPEQTNYYDVLEFRRRFYVISKYDMDDPQSLYMTFCDVRALILSGKVDMVLEKAIELMYYALHVDAPTKITKDTLPISDKEIPPYIPQGMKPSSSKSKKILLDMLSKIKIDSRDFAMIKYIQIARALPTFGTEAFLVVLVEEKKGHQVRTNVHLYVGPYRVFIKDENKKRELVEVPYKRFISLETVENELSMKYCGDDFKARYVDIESEAAEEIASLILSHLNIHKQILMKRVEDNDQSGVDRLELLTIFCSDIEHAKRCVYDMKDKGRQIIDKAIKYLNLNPRGQYSCLLRRCDDEFTWVHDDEVIGIYNPFDGLTVHIYMTYMPVEVSTNTFKRTMLLNIERPIHQLIDEIAFKMYVDFPLGYTLYRYEGNEKIALDLYETIPEQVIEFSKLFFQRRFLLTTHEDVLSPWISPLIYPDVVRNILSGIPVVEDKDFKIAKELVIYQIIASSASGEEAVRTFGSKNVMEYLPKDMKVPKNFRESILSNLRNNMTLKKQLAISKLIITARALNHFGCMIFPSQLDDKSKPSNKKEPQRKNCMISIGPFGVHLYAQGNNNLIIDFAKIDYSNVVSFTIIKDRIILRVSEDGGIPHIITVISKYSVQIHKLLRQYKNILIPMMDERKEIQGLAHSVEIKSLLEKSKVKSIQVYPERQLDHPNPHIFQFGKNMKSDELAALGLYYIVYPNKSSHTILATNRRKPDEKDVSYTWLKPNEDLFTANPVDNSYMFIIESTPLAQIITPDNFVYEKRYLIEEIIISICKSFTIDFKLGTHLGYTLYEMMNGKQRPLDFLFPVPLVSPNYVELLLKRRFYLFSLEILNDPLSLESGYEDVKAMVLSGTLIMSVETSLDLTMYSLYAESNTQQEVLVKANEINEEDLKYIIPRNISVSPAILRKFKAVATSTVPVDNKQAKIRYIILANSINGYGAENYPCLFTDRVDVTKKARRPANIILTPYRITVEDERTRKFFTVISWHTINVYDRINNTVELTYNNEDGVFCHIELESVPYSREIFSFINDMLELLRRPEFAEFPDFMGGSKNKLGANDFSGYGYNDNDNHSSMYDDISNIDARGLDLVFGDGDTDKDGYDFDDGTNDRFKDADGNDYCWRASDDGLLMNRAGNLLDNMFDDLNLIRNNLGEMDPNDLYRQLNFMNDELRRFANELEGEDRDRFLSLSSGLDGLRETAQQIARSDMEISSFIPQLQSMIDKYMCALSPAQQFFTQKLKALQLKSGDDPDLGTPRTLRLPHDDGNLAMMLLNLSDIQEQIASCLHKNYGNITPIIDPASLIRQLQGASTTLTTFAANLVNQNGDPEMIRRHLIPQLNDVGKIREIISALVDKGRKMNIKLPGLDDLCSQLGTSLQGILSSSSLTRVNPGQRKYFSMYPGQIKPLENVLPEFESLLKSVDTLMAHPSIKANPPLQHSIFAKCKHISQDIESLLAAIKVLKINANDDLARSEALAALLDAKASFEFLSAALQPLGNVPQIASFLKKLTDGYPKVISALNQLSPVNITPVNCQFVLDDVNMLLNRYASLSPEVVERLTDQERNSTAKTISFLKDFVQQFDRIVPALDKSPTSGEVVFLAQKSLLRLYDMLPDIQGFATALHRITIDQTYPVLYERLITNVRSTLNEPDSTEDISKLPHLINFQQLQVDTGNVMNLIRQICIHPRILTDPDLKERIETLFKQLKDNYLQQVLTRVQIRERPFSDDSIVLAHDIVARLRMLIDKMQPTARKVSDITSNLQLEQLLNALMLQSDKTLELLKKAKMEPFHLPPKVQDVQKLAEATYKMNQVIVALSKLNSVTKDGAVLEAFTNAYESLNSSYENLKALEKNPTNDFYRIAGKLQKSLIKLTPFISPIPEFNKNAQHRKVMSDLYDAITNALKSTPPTLEIVKSTVKGLQPCLLDFTNLLNAFLKAQNVKSNKEATNLFNGWLVDINEANTIISECINSKDFDISMANAIKVALLNLMKKLSSMPLNVRDVLTKEQKIELATKLGNLAKLAILTVNCIRQLPGNKRIYSNPHHFKKIEADDEFIESIQAIGNQCGSLQEFFKDLIEAKTLGDRPYAFALIQELQNQLSWVSLNDFKPNIPESKQLTIMQQLKERIPFVVTSTELIAPIIGDPNIVKNIKLFGDNLTIMTRLLSSPHLTAETAEKFKALVTPQMNKLLLEIDPVIKKDSVKSIRLLLDSLNSLNNVLALSSRDIKTAKSRRTQQICDQIYQTSALVLPHLQENPDHEKLLNGVNDIFELCSVYTSLPQMRVRFSDCLLCKKPIFTDAALLELSKQTSEILRNRDGEIKDDFFDNIADNLEMIIDHHDSVPAYVERAAKIEISPLKSHILPEACGSVRTIVSTSTSPKLIEDLLSRLVVDSAICAAMQINSLSKSLPFLQQQIEQNPTMFNDETRFNYVKLENAIKHSDTALLLQCQSLPTAVFSFKAMRTVDDSLQLLLQSIAGIDKIKSIVQPLMGCGKEYSNWIFQSDLAMMSYFQANMDSITISLENSAINDKTHSLPPTTRQFIRQAVSLLRFKERGYSYDMTIISKLAQLFLKFQTDILPQIKTKLSDSDSKKDILYHSDALDKIKSVLKLWANPIEGLSNESLRLTVSASLFNSIATVKSIQDSIDSESILIPHLFQPLNSKLSLVLAKLEKGVELKMPFKDSQVSSVTAHRFSKEISSEEALLNVSQLKVDSDKLLNLISSCSSLVIKAVPIEFADFDEIQLFSGSYQSLFALIDDKDCLKFAQAIAAYLDKLLQSMKTMSTSSDIISNGPQKYFTPLQIKGQNGKPLNITTVPSKLNNFVGAYTTRFINDNSIKNISKSLEKSIESASQPSVHLRECSFEEIQRLMLAQRFSILQQQQIAEFPDVIKTIAIKGNLPYLNLTTDTIDSAIQSLQQQYEALNSPSDLRKVQSRFSPEQIYVQQVVLTHAIHSIVQKRCSLPTATAAQSTNSSRKMLFEEILKYLESNGSPSETASFDDLHSGVSRGFSQISLINQLIAIMQQLNVNSPDIFKFIQTVEGGQFLKMPITSHQLLEQQQNVIKQVQLSDAPEMLNAFQQNLLPEDIILQQRIIQHMLNLLSSEYGENLLLQKDLETSNTAILASINLQQQELIKTDTEILKLSAYVTPSDIIQWQNFSFNIFNRVCCAQTLLEIASRQLKLNSNAASLPKNVKNIKATKESTKAQHNNLLKEYDLINIDSLIKSLNKKQLEDEQNILGVSAFLALAPKIISGYDSNLGIIMSTIFSSLQTQQSEQLRFTGEPLNGFNPLKDSSIINEHEIADFTCLNLRRIHQIKYLMSHFEIQFPELKKLSIPTFTQDQLNQTKAILTRIMENSSNPILTNQFIDKEIPKDEIPKLYSLLTVSATHTSAQSIDLDTIQELKNESNLFDMAALIQRQSDIGFSSASPNEKMVLPLEQLKSAIETCKIKFICEAAKEFVNNLMIIHSTVYPEVATISMCATDLNSLFENNKGDIENQIGSITSQFKVINESEKLNSILRRLSPSSYLTQQVMLQSLIKMLDSEQVRQVIVASADLNDSNAILDILSSLTGILGSQYQTDKTTFTNAKPPLHNELTLSSKLLEENKGRLSLAMKLFNLQLNIRTAFGNVETIIASNKDFQSATNEPFTIDEIVNIQDTFRIILATDTVNTTEIANYFKVQKPQITTRMLSLLNNLTLIISPKSLGLSLVKADSSSPDEEIYGLPSLFNSMQIIRDTGIGSTTTEIKIPSEKQRANRVAGSLNGILTILPTMIHIPIEECLSILIAENQAALEIVKDLYKSKSTAYSKRIPDLIEIIPQLLSSLARSMTTFPLNIRSMIVKEPIEIITSIENIQKLSCLESTPENSASFKTQLTTLLSALSNIDAATSKPSDDLLLRSIECFARMATAIQRNDIDTLNYQICVFKALTVHATIYKLNDSYLKSIIPGIEKVTPIVKEKFTTHSTLDSNKQQILSSFRDQLVQIINKETKNPFTFLNSLNKQGDIPPVINKSKVDLENSTNGLINSVHLRDRESTVTNIGDIIKVITLSQSTMAKSFNLTKATTIPAYTDYVTMINSSLNAMRATMDIVKTTAISSTAIRRSTRSFARMLNSMIDIAEDQANISDNKSSPSKLEKCRLDFLKSVCDSVQMVTATVSTRATCFIPETFVLFTKSELPKLQQQIASLKKVGCELSTTNTDKSATEDFTAEINKLEESLNLFQNLSSDNNKIESPNSIFNLTNGFINIVDHVTKAISVSQRFTDKVQLKPDLESAEKLKKFYHVPSVPSDTDKLKVSDASRSLETFISTYKTKATAFFTLVDNKSSKNAQIVDSMNSLYDNIDNVVKQILRISATTMNLGIQSELTTLCVGIAKSYDSLLKGLRAKFVLSGDWDKQGKILYKQINENIDTALALSKKAVKIADEESRMKSAIFTKFDECLKPLIQVTSTLDKSKEKISKLESTTPCEYSLRMLEIAIALSSAVNKVMLHSRGHTNNLTPAHETLFKFTQNISKELTQIEKATSEITNPNYKNDIEPKIIERMKTIFELGTQYTKSSKTSSPEETALRDAITTICKGANSLAQSAESALNARKEREGGKINSVKAGPSKDTLLKRLDLESKVIRARIVLEFNEKVLASMQ